MVLSEKKKQRTPDPEIIQIKGKTITGKAAVIITAADAEGIMTAGMASVRDGKAVSAITMAREEMEISETMARIGITVQEPETARIATMETAVTGETAKIVKEVSAETARTATVEAAATEEIIRTAKEASAEAARTVTAETGATEETIRTARAGSVITLVPEMPVAQDGKAVSRDGNPLPIPCHLRSAKMKCAAVNR